MNPARNPRPTVALVTLGCKVNQAESETMVREFAEAGFEPADFDARADVYLLNSCTVTHIADRKSRQLVRQARRRNPEALVVVTGCYAEMDGKDIATSIGADLVVGNADKTSIVALVRESLRERFSSANQAVDLILASVDPIPSPPHLSSRTRAMVKVQDGCNNFCSYCIVPVARGRERSVPLEEVLAEAQSLVAAGYKEIVLTGVHAGAYGKGMAGRPSLALLVERILAETGVERLRLSSIEPWDLDPALLDFLKDPRFCRHFHLPLQSGSDSVLRRMRRRYTTSEFALLLEQVRAADPEVAITTDVIVGFPGETAEEFAESLRFCHEMGFARMHVFRYSPRRDTGAAGMSGQIGETAKKTRSEAMIALSSESESLYRRRFIGKRLMVLWENRRQLKGMTSPVWTGLTDNYLRIDAVCTEEIGNRLLPACIRTESDNILWGEIVDSAVAA